MAGKGPGIYFNRRTKEIASVNGHEEEERDLKGWAKVSDDPTLRLLVVRELLLEKGLIRDATKVYWSGFRGSSFNGTVGLAATLSLSGVVPPVGGAASHRRGGALASARSALLGLVRSVFGSRRPH